jgi:hypothetical protein
MQVPISLERLLTEFSSNSPTRSLRRLALTPRSLLLLLPWLPLSRTSTPLPFLSPSCARTPPSLPPLSSAALFPSSTLLLVVRTWRTPTRPPRSPTPSMRTA